MLEVEKALLAEKEKFDEVVKANETYKNKLIKYLLLINSLGSEKALLYKSKVAIAANPLVEVN